MNQKTRDVLFFFLFPFIFSSFSVRADDSIARVIATLGIGAGLALIGVYAHHQYEKKIVTDLYLDISEHNTYIQQDPHLKLLEDQISESEQDLIDLVCRIKKNQPLPLKNFLDQICQSLSGKIEAEIMLYARLETKIKKCSDIKTYENLNNSLPEIRNNIQRLSQNQNFIKKNYHALVFLDKRHNTIAQIYKKELGSQELNRKYLQVILDEKYPLGLYQDLQYIKDIHRHVTSLKESIASSQISEHWEAYRTVKEKFLPRLEEISSHISSSAHFKQDIKDQRDYFERAQHRALLEKEARKQTDAQQKLMKEQQKKNYLEQEKIRKIDKQNDLLKEQNRSLSESNRIKNSLEQSLEKDQSFKDCIDKPLKNLEKLLNGLQGAGKERVFNIYSTESTVTHIEKISSDFSHCKST